MARVTVEDCIDKVDSPYELVLVAKERATQLNSGIEPTVDKDNDKNTVISLREIAADKVKVPDLEESAIYKLRKHVEQVDDTSEEDEDVGDDFENLYKGEISKSGTPILPSKRVLRDLKELSCFSKDKSSQKIIILFLKLFKTNNKFVRVFKSSLCISTKHRLFACFFKTLAKIDLTKDDFPVPLEPHSKTLFAGKPLANLVVLSNNIFD